MILLLEIFFICCGVLAFYYFATLCVFEVIDHAFRKELEDRQ